MLSIVTNRVGHLQALVAKDKARALELRSAGKGASDPGSISINSSYQ